ncbi:MAG: radical SAM protein [Deferribacterota bacterium]|nr:radical SAM protein [Deferribacterota bacterium]
MKAVDAVNILNERLKNCDICPHKCNINRLKFNSGNCKSYSTPKIYSYNLHFGEESLISGVSGSGTIFFSSCNMHCIYCQNYTISQNSTGETYSRDQLVDLFFILQNKKAHNINLVTPTHYIPKIAESILVAKERGLNLPIIYNCGGYESIDTIKLLEGLIDIYLPDFKYSDDSLALHLSKAKNYPFYAATSIKEMYRQVGKPYIVNGIIKKGLLIRHLILPNYIDNSIGVLYLLKDMIDPKDVYLNLMDQYYPAYKAFNIKNLRRTISQEEYNYLIKKASSLGFNLLK